MLKETDMDNIRHLAKLFVQLPINKTNYSPFVVKHPFTDSGIVYISDEEGPRTLDVTNDEKEFNKWKKMVSGIIDKMKSVADVYMLLTNAYKFAFLQFAQDMMSMEDYCTALVDCWIGTECPNQDPNFTKRQLLQLFEKANKNYIMTDEEWAELQELPQTVTIYRGVTDSGGGNEKALSWTINPQVAEWFAKRFGGQGKVYCATVDKDNILALFNGRNESEVIVRYSRIQNLTSYQCQSEEMTVNM